MATGQTTGGSVRQQIVESRTRSMNGAGKPAASEALADLAFQYAYSLQLKAREGAEVKAVHDRVKASEAAAQELEAKARALGANNWDISIIRDEAKGIVREKIIPDYD